MKWQEIRNQYPRQWLLVEAIKARSEANKRILEELAVIDVFQDSDSAMKAYTKFHREDPDREYYVFHTSREFLDVHERTWIGVREHYENSKP